MLSDDEILGLWSEGKTQPPARPVLGRKKVLAFARAVERAAYERAVDACFEQSNDMASRDYNFAIDDCAAAIRALGRQHD